MIRLSQRVALVAVLSSLLTACGSTTQGRVATGPALPLEPAVAACARAQQLVASTTDRMTSVVRGNEPAGTALPVLAEAARLLQQHARAAGDDVVERALQEAADAVLAYVAVAGDTSVGGHQDVVSDGLGKLRAFYAVCPVRNSGMERGTTGWSPGGPGTSLELGAPGHSGAASLVLRNRSRSSSSLSVVGAEATVTRTVGGFSYRAGLWARTGDGPGTLTLSVLERAQDGRLLRTHETRSAVTGTWSFTGLRLVPTALGSTLHLSVAVAPVVRLGAVQLDDIALARY